MSLDPAEVKSISSPTVSSTTSSSQIETNNEIEGIGTDILQFFQNLNWNVVEPSEYKACLTQFLPSEKANKTKSHALRLINSQCYPYPQKEYNFKEATNKSIESLSYYVPGVDSNEIILPQSALTKQEQYELYVLLCRMKFRNPPLNDRELLKLQAQMQQTALEHGNFQIFASKQWMNHHCNRCSEIPSSVDEFINKLWKCQLQRCLSLYPPLYKKKTHIALSLNDPNKDHSVMDFIDCIKYEGSLPKLSFPSLKTRCDLITDIRKLSQIKQVFSAKEGPQAQTVTPSVRPASVDPKVDIIIAQNNIDVVLTVSVIKTIVDVYDYQKEWILPITIKNVLKTDGELNKKVVIIDKKLPASGMSVYDKNVWHAKIAAKWALALNYTPSLFDREPAPSDKERKLISYEEINPVEVAKFGSNVRLSETKLEKQLSPAAGTDKENLSNKLENLSILGNGVEETNLADDKSENVSGNDRKRKSMSDSLPDTTSATSPTSDTSPRHTLIAKRYKPINSLQKYTLWGLHKSTHFNMSKQEQRYLKVLVRHRVDGNLMLQTNGLPRSSSHHVVVTSKLEYQPELGASQMSKSELIRDYVDLYISKVELCRVRSVGHTKELMLFEMKNLQEIKDCLQQLHRVETHKVFDPLYAVLTKLIDLPAGHYMLQHTPKMGAFAQLLAESEQHIDFNLISHCEKLENLEVNLPAAPIDPYVLTKLHFRDKKPPALFIPKSNTSTAKFLMKPAYIPELMNKKKKKKKKNKGSVVEKTE